MELSGKQFNALMQYTKKATGIFTYPILEDNLLFFSNGYSLIAVEMAFDTESFDFAEKDDMLVLRFDKHKILVKDKIIIETSGIYLNGEKIGRWGKAGMSNKPQLKKLLNEAKSMAGQSDKDEINFYFSKHGISRENLKNISDIANAFVCDTKIVPCCKKHSNGKYGLPVIYCEYKTNFNICGVCAPVRF